MIYIGAAITNAAVIAGAAYLATGGHWFLAFICLLCIQSVRTKEKP